MYQSGLVLIALYTGVGAAPVMVQEAANQCRFEEALKILDVVPRSLARSQDERQLLRARLLLQLGKYSEVLATLSSMKGAPAGEAELRQGLALANLGREGDALAAFESAEKSGADSALVAGGRGLAAMGKKDWERAEALLIAALKIDSNLAGALYNLACVRVAQGRLPEAAGLIRQAWSVGWRNREKLQSDTDLTPLRNSGLIADLLGSKSDSRCLTW